MDTELKSVKLLRVSEELLKSNEQPLLAICQLLNSLYHHFNWVGFYFMNDTQKILKVGPYVGEVTYHSSIPYGKGICGQVAISGNTFVVDNVGEQDNYLACSISTKAEIVVPLYYTNKLIGQLDIDSDVESLFTDEDRILLENLCDLIAKYPNSFSSHLPE